MGRIVNTHVLVNGVIYEPGTEVPADVAEGITADVFESDGSGDSDGDSDGETDKGQEPGTEVPADVAEGSKRGSKAKG